jgi:hypothetical protein
MRNALTPHVSKGDISKLCEEDGLPYIAPTAAEIPAVRDRAKQQPKGPENVR